MATVLIASLGDSPVVVTAMFNLLNDKLLKEEKKGIDLLEVLYPKDGIALFGYEDLIYKALQQKCKVEGIPLDCEDVDGEDATYDFLRKLYRQLNTHQKNGDVVYLSLAGGRKGMASLMALLAPLFLCVRELYHILDKDEGKRGQHFWSTTRLCEVSTTEQQGILFPSHDRVNLISIPYGEKQHLSKEVRDRLSTITDEQLDDLWEQDTDQAEMVEFYNPSKQSNDEGGLLTVELTGNAAKQYRTLLKHDVNHSRKFTTCFKQMHYAKQLMTGWRTNKEDGAHDIFPSKPLGRIFHFYKSHKHTTERAVYHTEPQDIASTSAAYIKKVVISELEIEVSGRYRSLEEIVNKPKISLGGRVNFDRAFPEESGSQEHILIVPIATSPMVATQLYQLYIDKGYKVHSVILVHTQHPDVRTSVEIACDAFKNANVTCEAVPLKGWDDIDDEKKCTKYQDLLEQTIRRARQQTPSCQIELTISGGRKAMAAMAIFAAQQQDIHRIVHTVIDESINDKILEETKVEELKKLERTNNKKKRDDRLFLRAYPDHKDAFILFKIPVLPARKANISSQ